MSGADHVPKEKLDLDAIARKHCAKLQERAPVTDKEVKEALQQLATRCRLIQEAARDIAVGREARIVSKFNGQPHGRSKPPLTGEVFMIDGVCLYEDGSYSFFNTSDRRINSGFGPEDVEFV